jgi:hypothetical protein
LIFAEIIDNPNLYITIHVMGEKEYPVSMVELHYKYGSRTPLTVDIRDNPDRNFNERVSHILTEYPSEFGGVAKMLGKSPF